MNDGTLSPQHDARCESTAPDLFTVQCELAPGHHGRHRNNMVTWAEPLEVTVGGQPVDTTQNSDHWRDGNVILTGDVA